MDRGHSARDATDPGLRRPPRQKRQIQVTWQRTRQDKTGHHIPGTTVSKKRQDLIIGQYRRCQTMEDLIEVRRVLGYHVKRNGYQFTPMFRRELESLVHSTVLRMASRVMLGSELCHIYNTTLTWKLTPQVREQLDRIFERRKHQLDIHISNILPWRGISPVRMSCNARTRTAHDLLRQARLS